MPREKDRDAPLVVFLGDSLTAGYGLPANESFPARVASMLESEGTPIRIVNAGVSGDTTAGGLARLDWFLRQEPDVLVVCLGGNDGLRGLPLDRTEANLTEIVGRAKAAGVSVLLVGLKMPPSYGEEYTTRFEAIYPAVARAKSVRLVPFLLEGVGGDPALNLDDGIHPNTVGQERLARNVLPHLREIIVEVGGSARRRKEARRSQRVRPSDRAPHLLHVAGAIDLRKRFVSGDDCQLTLAKAAGLEPVDVKRKAKN